MLDMERINEIQATFKVRPIKFVTEENGIAVKRHKSNAARPKAWALTPVEIDAIDQQFIFDIKAAHAARSKSLLPLQRDRVMFHLAIHFALRVSELVTIQLHDFKASHDPRMKAFQNFGTLTITGKNDATGTIPMREPEIYELLMWYLANIRQKSSSAGRALETDFATTTTKSMRLPTSYSQASVVASSTPTLSATA